MQLELILFCLHDSFKFKASSSDCVVPKIKFASQEPLLLILKELLLKYYFKFTYLKLFNIWHFITIANRNIIKSIMESSSCGLQDQVAEFYNVLVDRLSEILSGRTGFQLPIVYSIQLIWQATELISKHQGVGLSDELWQIIVINLKLI